MLSRRPTESESLIEIKQYILKKIILVNKNQPIDVLIQLSPCTKKHSLHPFLADPGLISLNANK